MWAVVFRPAVAAQEGLYLPKEFHQACQTGTRSYDGRPGPNHWQNTAAVSDQFLWDAATLKVDGHNVVISSVYPAAKAETHLDTLPEGRVSYLTVNFRLPDASHLDNTYPFVPHIYWQVDIPTIWWALNLMAAYGRVTSNSRLLIGNTFLKNSRST